MDAEFLGEDESDIGVEVVDNNDAEHHIEMHKKDGEIYAHHCDAYADKPRNRTPAENEHNEQARRFAQYYVYQERGYDTVPPEIHPERINAVRRAVQSLSDEEFDSLFGELRQQLLSYHDYEAERPITIPPLADDSESVLYRQHVYLGFDPSETNLADDLDTLATIHDIDLDNLDQPVSELSDAARSAWQAFTDHLETLAEKRDVEADQAFSLGGVSSVYTAYVDEEGHEHIGEPEKDPFDREADTLIELAPIDPGPLEQFREYFDHYLQCQIRDCFIRMGVEPPEQFRVLGPGRIEAAEQYMTLDLFPDYTDPENESLLTSI